MGFTTPTEDTSHDLRNLTDWRVLSKVPVPFKQPHAESRNADTPMNESVHNQAVALLAPELDIECAVSGKPGKMEIREAVRNGATRFEPEDVSPKQVYMLLLGVASMVELSLILMCLFFFLLTLFD